MNDMCPTLSSKPQKSEKNLKIFIHTGSEIFVSDLKLSPIAHTSEIIYSCRIQIIHNTLKVNEYHWLKKTFVPDLNSFIPGLKYLYRIQNYLSQLIVPRILFILDPPCYQTVLVKFIFSWSKYGTDPSDWSIP